MTGVFSAKTPPEAHGYCRRNPSAVVKHN